ncbi:hypothetical protein F5Y05DRAFT_328666 [Hypoxylon sp. FL0543]|nr:hypothetical protein F5Y05DRAFT_328666 [Hypoxylon sp. FL0543]
MAEAAVQAYPTPESVADEGYDRDQPYPYGEDSTGPGDLSSMEDRKTKAAPPAEEAQNRPGPGLSEQSESTATPGSEVDGLDIAASPGIATNNIEEDKDQEEEKDSEDARDDTPVLAVYREIEIKSQYDNRRTQDDGSRDPFDNHEPVDNKQEPIVCTRVFDDKARGHVKTVLRINSPVLIQVLKDTLSPSRDKYYSKLYSYKATIRKPYAILFQNRQRLQVAARAYQAAGQAHQAALLDLLLKFLKDDMPDTWDTLDKIEAGECTHIGFNNAWLLYKPGTTVYTMDSGVWRAYKVAKVTVRHSPQMTPIVINGYYLNFTDNGSRLTPVAYELEVTPFAGDRLISHLEVVPESHLADQENIISMLRSRGQKFWELHGQPAYRQYDGDAWPATTASNSIKVMIDYVTSSQHDEANLYYQSSEDCNCSVCVKKYAGLDSYPDTVRDGTKLCVKDKWPKRTSIQDQNAHLETTLDELLIFCPSSVWAFSLKQKSWELVDVDNLSPVQSQQDPFKKLVLNATHKTVVESMVETRISNAVSDIIKEKGRGLVVLLHGGPGTGKTLTAECVADSKRMPLYMVTCGDLGTNPNELEKHLERVFRDAVNWKAVLLLDEADVFLQERDLQNLERNALVSVFLRHIEYYDGILFLTTNRPGQIDEAFQSRIHITLGLPELDFERQKEVWKIFINQLHFPGRSKEETREKKLELLKFVQKELGQTLSESNHKMNGRQIRNCIRAASAIANKQNRTIEKKDILSVIEIGTQFRDYMTKLNRMNMEEKARALGLRAGIPN